MDWDREKLLRMLRIDSKMAMADNVQASEGCELLRYKSGVLELYARPKKVPRACSPRRSIRARYARLERAICKDARMGRAPIQANIMNPIWTYKMLDEVASLK
jgi:hypothetical protein